MRSCTGCLLAVLLATILLAAVLLVAALRARGREEGGRRRAERLYFERTYGASVERMLAESPIDREEVRRLRELGEGSHLLAVRYVRAHDPVPLKAAVTFVERV